MTEGFGQLVGIGLTLETQRIFQHENRFARPDIGVAGQMKHVEIARLHRRHLLP